MSLAQPNRNSKFRRWVALSVFGVLGLVLTWRAVDLQLSDRDFLQDHGEARYLRTVTTEAHRGMITDRHDEPLAISTPVNSVWAKPSELIARRDRWAELAKLLEISQDQLQTMVSSATSRP
jgi:cell division protein FtsI (penicillin-binding protein 3)